MILNMWRIYMVYTIQHELTENPDFIYWTSIAVITTTTHRLTSKRIAFKTTSLSLSETSNNVNDATAFRHGATKRRCDVWTSPCYLIDGDHESAIMALSTPLTPRTRLHRSPRRPPKPVREPHDKDQYLLNAVVAAGCVVTWTRHFSRRHGESWRRDGGVDARLGNYE